MTRSIRQFLLFNLLLSLVLVTMLTVLGTLLLDHKDIQRHTDAELMSTALLFQTIFSNVPAQNIQDMQRQINTLGDAYNKLTYPWWQNKLKFPQHYDLFQFQIWDRQGQLLLHSKHAPREPLSNGVTGFRVIDLNNNTWRVYTLYEPNTGLSVVVALNHKMRNHLEARITEDYVFIALLTSPLLAILIWVIVGQGLNILSRVTNEVGHRAPSYLEPVDLESVPIELKPLVDELNYLFERLKDAFEREKRFAGDAAHELRTPLAAVKTQAQVALRAAEDTERYNALLRVLTGVDRCTHVIQQLLTLSRMVPEATLDDPRPLNLVALTKEVIALMVPSALKKSIDIELFAPKDVVMMKGNATAISILIRNLIDNAIRYTPERSYIQVYITDLPQAVSLKVIDNGPGIPPELRARVFERFFRILGTQSSGSGLGLAIVQQIAQLHKASVSLNEPPTGKGLEVSVEFLKE